MFIKSSKSNRFLIILLSTILIMACIPTTAVPTPIPPTNTLIVPSDTPVPPTFTASPLPSATNTQIPPTQTSLPPSETPSSNGQQTVFIYLIAIDDNGISGKLIGCGDSLVPVQVLIKPTTGVLRAALNAMLSIHDQYYGESGLYNALYQSSLQIADVSIVNGQAIIHLTGTIMMGGECDIPRVEAQLTEIALQFSTVSSVSVFINDIPLKDFLSLK